MKLEFESVFAHELKDAVMIAFLKDDLEAVQINDGINWVHPDDIKYNKKLVKAYKTILKYYGVNDE